MDAQTLLQQLPPVRDEWEVIKQDQDVPDIIKQIVRAHKDNEKYYDRIALYFDGDTVAEICDNIYDFIKENIEYREESQGVQTTAIPQGILTRGYGDCKHYASFAGGILSALQRLTGKKFSWHYCFASYKLWQPMPYHVFVIVSAAGKEYWIDPTPGAEGKTPVWVVDKKLNQQMPLYNQVAGVELPQTITGPRRVGGWFDDAFKGIQHFAAGMGMQVPRASFLALVDINAFGLANKLDNALNYPDIKSWLADKWERLGGTFSKLESAIKHGTTHVVTDVTDINNPPVTLPAGMYRDAAGVVRYSNGAPYIAGHIGEAAATASIIASAALIIAAIIPVITKLLAAKNVPATIDPVALDTLTGLPVGVTAAPSTGDAVKLFISENPIPIALGVGLLLYYVYENQ